MTIPEYAALTLEPPDLEDRLSADDATARALRRHRIIAAPPTALPWITTDCWLYDHPHPTDGYGRVRWPRSRRAHLAAYELFVGPVPPGLELDHLCRRRDCFRPGHLQPVTRSVNVTRQDHHQRRKTHCAQGHPYDAANTFFKKGYPGRRLCRQCHRDARARWRAANRLRQADNPNSDKWTDEKRAAASATTRQRLEKRRG